MTDSNLTYLLYSFAEFHNTKPPIEHIKNYERMHNVTFISVDNAMLAKAQEAYDALVEASAHDLSWIMVGNLADVVCDILKLEDR